MRKKNKKKLKPSTVETILKPKIEPKQGIEIKARENRILIKHHYNEKWKNIIF